MKQSEQTPDFSLVLGGPLYQIFRRAYLSGPVLELLQRRVLFLSGITWLPPLLLSAIAGHLVGGQGLPFLRDIETHVRFLVALPVLVIAELVVHRALTPVVKLFVERGVVTDADTPKFYAAVETALRARNSIALELALLIFAFTAGHWVWSSHVALGTASWYGTHDGMHLHLTLPGYWYGYVSIPLAQFIIFRWYMRLAIWFWLLWRISRLNLRLLPTHPDRAGGIGFLGERTYAFGPILFAEGAVTAGILANRIFHEGHSLMSLQLTILGLVSFFVLMILVPLIAFTPRLHHAKRHGLKEYGTLATTYVEDFDQKWLRGGAKDEAILGTGDIQSLADLANSFAIVREMRVVPFVFSDALLLVVVTAMPFLGLLLTIIPLNELVSRLIKIVFS